MTDLRYKAFISYSHRDESWAAWLHKALESYRVPRALAGARSTHGDIPERLFPVFRDRDELSSGASLSDKVQHALELSDALIVICSPAAAASRWVNEEIRAFRALGRGDRILALIVDGDPQAVRLEDSCFPPALLESELGEVVEPLAADARKWADGKTLAKLKLVSGILDVRLDELRQREQKRQFRRRLVGIAALAVAALLALSTFTARIEERVQRENAERLVAQIVLLSKDLDTRVDLETLKQLAEQLHGYLDEFDPDDLSPESTRQVALVLRQLGRVNKAQGRLEEAMEALQQSRTLLATLVEQMPEESQYIFELGNAEFYVAEIHMEYLDFAAAEQAMMRYREQAVRLFSSDPQNVDWIIEMSSAHTNLAALAERKDESDVQTALGHIDTAIDYLKMAMALDPGNDQLTSQYSGTLAWFADTHLRACNLESAWMSRVTAESLARALSSGDPANNRYKRDHAYRLTGLARVLRYRGEVDAARQRLTESRDLLEDLLRSDPSNAKFRWELVRQRALIAKLDLDDANTESALGEMRRIMPEMRDALLASSDENLRRSSQFARFLMDYSEGASRVGERSLAVHLLDEAITVLQGILAENQSHRASLDSAVLAEFLWRHLHGDSIQPFLRDWVPDLLSSEQPFWSCQQADLAARQAILREARPLASQFVAYLSRAGYVDPDFRAFCTAAGLCAD